MGGDEYNFACENLNNPEDAEYIAKKMLLALTRKIYIDSQEISISGRIGISLFPEDGGEAWDLLHYADTATYRVKGRESRPTNSSLGPEDRSDQLSSINKFKHRGN